MADQHIDEVSAVRILIADDERQLVDELCQLLAAEGYVTQGVDSGQAALAALREALERDTRFAILITDLVMPDMDGIALLRAARKLDSDLVSIIMTGYGAIDTAVEAMHVGALDYILKPFKLNIITPVLTRAHSVRQLRLDNAALLKQLRQRSADLEAANTELRRANVELEGFTHSVSHDLRQPLHGVIGFGELLMSEKPGKLNDTQREYLADVIEGGRRLLRLTEDLLQFSRAAHQPLRRQRVAVAGLVAQVIDSLRQADPGREVELRIGELPDASADPGLLKQVFVNLLANAFKFSRKTPHALIEVQGSVRGTELVYRIRDNGAGFDARQSERLFAIFQRLHADRDFEGTGVGLSIVQRIIERHGGAISATGEVGQGATFTFTLPV